MRARNVAFAICISLLYGCTQEAATEWTPDGVAVDQQQVSSTAVAAFGDALPGLTADELALFQQGKEAFEETEGVADGLGPVFNEDSCVACHAGPETGGSNGRLETRFGRRNQIRVFSRLKIVFDPLEALGGSLLQDHGIGEVPGHVFAAEAVPLKANVVASRRTTPLFGLGLVDATPDDQIRSIASWQARNAPDVAGTIAVVDDLFTGRRSVGKFGWKSQNPTLLQFSGDAYLNEMGITSPKFPDENCPQGDCTTLAFNPRPDLNDADGADVQAFADFMTLLAPPPRADGTFQSRTGESIFRSIGCALCHVPTLVTGRNAVQALNQVAYHPYSDFLLHDMGSLGDGIEQGPAGARQMRTAPLWGLRVAPSLLHDGRAATPRDAILAHDGQGRRARNRFASLDARSQAALLAFLETL